MQSKKCTSKTILTALRTVPSRLGGTARLTLVTQGIANIYLFD